MSDEVLYGAGASMSRRLARRGRTAKAPTILAVAVTALAAFVVFGPLLAPHDPYETDILNRLAAPSLAFPLGTDAMGRCLLSRLLYGARLTTLSALGVVAVAASAGILLGLIAAYCGGFIDRLIMRLTEGVAVLPALAVSMVVAGVLGLGLEAVVIALAAIHWTEYARLVRNATLVERAKTYVLAAEAIGAPGWRIMLRHVLPNIGGPLLVLATYSLSWVILAFAGLSFLGLGVEPGTPEWGRMIAESRSHLREYPRLVLAPGLTIMTFVIFINLLGDALADRWRVEPAQSSYRKET
jgi:peptide/nickel transport system permease protein/nickel transport system permease protein